MRENLGHRFRSRLCNVLAGGLRQVPYPARLPGFVELWGQVWEEPLVQCLECQMGAWLQFLNLAHIPTCSIDQQPPPFYFSTGDQTQGLIHARSVPYL